MAKCVLHVPYKGSIGTTQISALLFDAAKVDTWVLGGLVRGALELAPQGSKVSNPMVGERGQASRKRKDPVFVVVTTHIVVLSFD